MSDNPYDAFHGHLEWRGDRLGIDVNDPIAKRLHKKALSPSTAHTIGQECQARWAIGQMLPRHDNPMDPAPLGTAAHAVLEDVFNLPADQRTPDQVTTAILSMVQNHPEVTIPDDPATLMQWQGIISERASNLWTIIDPTVIQVVSTELHLDDVTIADVPVNGYIDLLAEGAILDWKFKNKKPRILSPTTKIVQAYHEQQRVYTLGARAKGLDVKRADLIYVNHGIIDNVRLDSGMLEATKARFAQSWQMLHENLELGSFATRKSPLCGWCPLVAVCPTGQGTEAKVEDAKIGPQLGISTGEPMRPTTTAATTEPQEHTMTSPTSAPQPTQYLDNPAAYSERVPYEPYAMPGASTILGTGRNANSYGMSGLAELIRFSRECLCKQGIIDADNRAAVGQLATNFLDMVFQVQERIVGQTEHAVDIDAGISKMIRGALYREVGMFPVPFDQPERLEDWSKYIMTNMLHNVVAAFVLVKNGRVSADWSTFGEWKRAQ